MIPSQEQKTYTISVFAGSSGGHLFPAQAFAENFRKRFPHSRILLVTSRKAEALVKQMPASVFDDAYFLPAFPFPAGISFRSLVFLLEFFRAFILSSLYLSKVKPDLCAGFGSYVSYPGMMLAYLRKIPTLIHEQNLVPGKASRMLASRMDWVTATFDKTFSPVFLKNYEIVGLPVRSQLLEAAENTKKKSGKTSKDAFHLLVVGGSQGAHRLNELVCDLFLHLKPEEKEKIAVTHITGKSDSDWVREKYTAMGVSHQVFPFFDKMHELYREADMAITRAGANTLFELALFQVPAVVIPYPHAGAHQSSNADYFQTRDALISRQEEATTPEWLADQVLRVKNDAGFRRELSLKIGRVSMPNAGQRLVDLAAQLLEKERLWELSTAT